jgi:predicted DNA-binding ribbon-helix-helix protein
LSPVRKRSVSIRGHRTSFSLEDAFYGELERIATERGLPLAALVAEIDATRDRATNLSSALRLFVLEEVRNARRPGTGPHPPIVPELDVSDLELSLEFYLGVAGFASHIQRPEEKFAYLIREDARLMLQQAGGPGRRFNTAPLERPFGRGVNLQIETTDVDALHSNIVRAIGTAAIRVPLEERWYRHGEAELGNRQFVVADPDGYLLRFFSYLGERPFRR